MTEATTKAPAHREPGIRWGRLYRRNRNFLLGALSVTVALLLWQIADWAGWINPLLGSSPSKVWHAGVGLAIRGDLWKHFSASSVEFIQGYGLAILVGIPIGILLGASPVAAALADPFIVGLYTTPLVALSPILIVVFGIGPASKIAIVFLLAVFPLVFNTMTGMRVLDEGLVNMSRVFGANRWHIFRTVALPSCVPFIIAGLRLALGRGLIGVVVGEMLASTRGIGYLLNVTGQVFAMDKFFVAVFVIAISGIVLSQLLRVVERRFDVWRPDK